MGTVPTRVDRDSGGIVHFGPADRTAIAADELLVVTRPPPGPYGTGLEVIGIDPDARLQVEEWMQFYGTKWGSSQMRV